MRALFYGYRLTSMRELLEALLYGYERHRPLLIMAAIPATHLVASLFILTKHSVGG
jgi:hypothetical protein